MTDLIRLSAAALADKLAGGEVSSVEATQAHLDRIADVDGDVHAFLHVSDHALQVAGGRIVETGGPELALQLEEHGYAWIRDRVAPESAA